MRVGKSFAAKGRFIIPAHISIAIPVSAIRAVFGCCLVLILGGCVFASLTGGVLPPYEIERREESSRMANYVSAHVASRVRDSGAAAEFYGRLARQSPQDSDLLERAVRANIVSGDIDRALDLSNEASDQARRGAPAAMLVRAVDMIAQNGWKDVHALLSDPAVRLDSASLRLLADWAEIFAVDEGRGDDVDGMPPDFLPGPVAHSVHALVSLVEGRSDRALDALDEAWRTGMRYGPLAGEYLRLLRGADRDGDALAGSFRMSLSDGPGEVFGSGGFEPLIAPGDRRKAVALALSLLAREYLRGISVDRTIVHSHLALFLDADLDAARIILSDALASKGQSEAALMVLEGIVDLDSWRAAAESRKVLLLYDLGQRDRAVAVADAARVAVFDRSGQFRLARFFAAMGMHERAEVVLDQIISDDAAVGVEDWQMIFARARARERQDGRWSDAQADLRRALELYPDHPEILNYLGYSLIDRDLDIDEGLWLIKKALVKSPRAGHIVDSLGWAYYRLRRFSQAVIHLEDAVALVPTDPVINSHLGDAYWRSGRLNEARIQWRRAQSYSPDADLLAELVVKLQSGLE